MSTVSKNGKDASARKIIAVETCAEPAAKQIVTVPDGATAVISSSVACADAGTTDAEPVSPPQAQGMPIPANRTSATAEVPAKQEVQPPIVPLPTNEALAFLGAKPHIEDMTIDEKFACLKQCFAYGYGVRKVLCEVFESIGAEFKTYAKDRAGMPTVEVAFALRGLNYKTIHSAMQREKDRRAEDAKFFAAIKGQASANNVHGLDITDDDLPPVGTKVILGDGTKGQVLAVAEKAAPDAEPSFEVVIEDGTAVQVKRGNLVTLAELLAKKTASKAAKKNDPEAEKKKTDRIAAAAAKADAAAISDDFYAAQYFNLVALINSAPKNMTPVEFAQTVTENLTVAYTALSAEDAKRINPAPKMLPTLSRGTERKLFDFLNAPAVGRPAALTTVFGGIDKGSFGFKIEGFAQRICDKFYDGKYKVTVAEKTQPETPTTTKTAAKQPSKPDQPPGTKVGDRSEPTLHGFYYVFIKDQNPYAVRDANNPQLGVLCKLKGKTEAEHYICDRDREAAAGQRQNY